MKQIIESHIVTKVLSSIRLVDYCIGIFDTIPTKNAVKKAISSKRLLYNGIVAQTGFWIEEGDVIELLENRSIPKAFPLDIEVIFEDDYLAVVSKPGGLAVNGNSYRTLENCLVNQLTVSSQPDGYNWAKPVHRIDAATSGLVLFAKTHQANRLLAKQFEEHKIEKEYIAILSGSIENQSIELPIDDKNAVSVVRLLDKALSLKNGELCLVNLKPLTGRTHQLRIHCASIGHPIVGDQLYAGKGKTINHKGLFLQANKLTFVHPISGEKLSFQLEVPRKFHSLMSREARRWKKYN